MTHVLDLLHSGYSSSSHHKVMKFFGILSLVGVSLASAASVSCVSPYAGQEVQSLPCSGNGGASTSWSFTPASDPNLGGFFQAGASGLCLAVQGTIASDGQPAITLQTCNSNFNRASHCRTYFFSCELG